MGKFEHLLSPLQIRGYTYRNRIVGAPTLFAHSVFINEIRENVYRMVEARAKGGCAEVSTGEICFNFEEGICSFIDPFDYNKTEGGVFDSFREYAERIKKHGAVAMIEFCHEAGRAETKNGYVPYGPDACLREDGVQVYEMTEAIMDKICRDLRTAIRFMKKAGFDGVLFHGGHGFIIQQFISPLTNHRRDQYGGSMENRARFPIRLLREMREELGDGMLLELRISAQDGVEGGLLIDDTVEFCRLIDGMVDIIHVSNGLKWKGNRTYTFTDMYDVHGHNVQYAEQIKKAVKKSKVGVIGGINSPEFADRIIAEGKTDLVIFGRQMYADPEFANKVMDGQESKIRRCVRCFQCYPGSMEHATDIPFDARFSDEEKNRILNPASMGRCAINPKSNFRLYEDKMPQRTASRKVLVIGGGVAGMQAAITASERGHRVVLLEKSGELGGILKFTDIDHDKVDLRNFKNTLINELQSGSIEILMNSGLSEELVKTISPDIILAAVGSEPIIPPIPGIEYGVSALAAYSNMDQIGKRVVLIGGGLVGCEVALFLASTGREVTIAEARKVLASEAWCMYRTSLMDEIEKRNVKVILDMNCVGIGQKSVELQNRKGDITRLDADTVIFSTGMRPRLAAVDEIRKIADGIPVKLIGDCKGAGKVGDAVPEAYLAALEII